MTFSWPWMLLALVALPLPVLWYRWALRRRAARRAELAAQGLVAPGLLTPAGRPGRFRPGRHLTPILFLVAFALLLVGLARPQATISSPIRQGTVVLAFDVSASMAATDLAPTRLEAAKAAARAFVKRQPSTVLVGVVAFGATGLITAKPSSDKAAVLAAIDRLTPQGGTAVGRGILTSLSAVIGKPVQLDDPGSTAAGSVEEQGQNLGYHGSAAVILLTDGENTGDPDPLAAAQLASGAGVKVYPIGLGSPQGTVLQIDGFQVATRLDEALLRQIASTTDGTYFAAADQQQLASVYGSINPTVTLQAKRIEVTALFAAAAAVLLLLGAGLSVGRTGRVI